MLSPEGRVRTGTLVLSASRAMPPPKLSPAPRLRSPGVMDTTRWKAGGSERIVAVLGQRGIGCHIDEGKLIGFAKITRDLTERKDAEDAWSDHASRFPVAKDGGDGSAYGGLAHDFNNLLIGIGQPGADEGADGTRPDRRSRALYDGCPRCSFACGGADTPAACLCSPSNARSQADQSKPANRQPSGPARAHRRADDRVENRARPASGSIVRSPPTG